MRLQKWFFYFNHNQYKMKLFKTFTLTLVLISLSFASFSQQNPSGVITPSVLGKIKQSVKDEPSTRALINSINNSDVQQLALNRENEGLLDKYFSNRINTKGITDQKSSGRCWLYTGLNVIRIQVISRYDMEGFELSQTYPFFWDQLEKANLFLEGIIATATQPLDEKRVDWLLKNPIGDGGQWTGVVDVVGKYGLVPAEIMPDSKNSENTRWLSRILTTNLRSNALELRKLATEGKKLTELETVKIEMLGEVYRVLVLMLGEPPAEFSWRYKKTNGTVTELTKYTPMSFYKDFVQVDLSQYVMLMNDPSREFSRLYEIDYDRHIYEGGNWKYINLPAEKIKEYAKASILDNQPMYFSCDVGKQLNKEEGTLDVNNYNFQDLFGVSLAMSKAERIQTFESGSSHGMNLVGVDLDKGGNPVKWLLENSWGANSGFQGFLIMTDKWFDEYMFRLVVNKKYVPADVLKILDTQPILLPPWDPMFLPEE